MACSSAMTAASVVSEALALATSRFDQRMMGVPRDEQVKCLERTGPARRVELFLDGYIAVAGRDRGRHAVSFGRGGWGAGRRGGGYQT